MTSYIAQVHIRGICLSTVAAGTQGFIFWWNIFRHFPTMAALNDGEMRIVACTAPFLGVEKCEESTCSKQKTTFDLGLSTCPITVTTIWVNLHLPLILGGATSQILPQKITKPKPGHKISDFLKYLENLWKIPSGENFFSISSRLDILNPRVTLATLTAFFVRTMWITWSRGVVNQWR